MDLQVLSKDKKTGRITFLMKNASPALANAFRRVIMELVPTMAVEEVEFVDNSSVLYDEIIAHRLGLIPLKTDLKAYAIKKECKCGGEGCARCTLKLSLKAKGPALVTAASLKSKDPKVKPVFPETPIVKLLKGQNLELVATAVLGTGKQHAKFSPGLVWYTYEPNITVNNDSPKLAECKTKFPPQVFDERGRIDKKKIVELGLVDACDGVCPEVVKVDYNKNNFLFSIEPWGQLSPAEIVGVAAEKFSESLTDFEDKIKK